MNAERRKQILLGVLLVALAGTVYWSMSQSTIPPLPGAVGARPAPSARRPAGTPMEAPDVKLEALQAQWPVPETDSRNPFRFGEPRRVDVPAPVAPPPPPPPVATGPPPPPAVPPIALRLIGLVSPQNGGPRTAVFSDDRGTYSGREGDVIEGRYRIHRVTADSVEVSHLDGRGRQMLRIGG